MAAIGTDIARALTYLEQGAVIGIPTETVYGLAVSACHESALKRLYALKGRPLDHPLIVHIQDQKALDTWAQEVPQAAYQLAEAFWPGALTLVLPHKGHLPHQVSAGLPTLGLRVPAHPVMQALLARASFPLAAPSANRFGALSATCSTHVQTAFQDAIPYILEGGPTQHGIESSIVGFKGEEVLLYRTGAISKVRLEEVLKKPVQLMDRIHALEKVEEITDRTSSSRLGPAGVESEIPNRPTAFSDQDCINSSLSHKRSTPSAQDGLDHFPYRSLAPGMLKRHYAPRKALAVGTRTELLRRFKLTQAGMLCFQESCRLIPQDKQEILSPSGDLKVAAQQFFAALHRLENKDISLILAEWLPMHDIGYAINDRLRRAAYPEKILEKYYIDAHNTQVSST